LSVGQTGGLPIPPTPSPSPSPLPPPPKHTNKTPRDEQLDEARADLADMKELFRAQLEHLMAQLEDARRGGGGGEAAGA
jgi:hypothetical protein